MVPEIGFGLRGPGRGGDEPGSALEGFEGAGLVVDEGGEAAGEGEAGDDAGHGGGYVGGEGGGLAFGEGGPDLGGGVGEGGAGGVEGAE